MTGLAVGDGDNPYPTSEWRDMTAVQYAESKREDLLELYEDYQIQADVYDNVLKLSRDRQHKVEQSIMLEEKKKAQAELIKKEGYKATAESGLRDQEIYWSCLLYTSPSPRD